jgi:hypothetical protein
MFAETSTVLRAVAADNFFNCWYLEIPSDMFLIESLAHDSGRTLVCAEYQGASTIMRKAFD